jgi:hypothetical protein
VYYYILTNFILDKNSTYIIDYLNTIRIVYYLSRLSYFNKDKYRITIGKLEFYNILIIKLLIIL